ncbi:hypothetical protein GIY23_08815 [Allosaccharopolyspora coralli]|uniref:Uncharacterized protein n=1 Tax=Allosaccharopolyspora coralli TaxID=2665642 RepID=A0A5Q3QDN1_9PSEU|nr:hypothetical protein [Allosaccharopolyspora coralli]QGK69605.1 hypothetical protein GIY23_08815 [Allosaccharopolyspora coralli]
MRTVREPAPSPGAGSRTKKGFPVFDSESEALARLDELREQRAAAKRAAASILEELKAALRAAGALRIDGVAINRSVLIEHSGLSRRTAYQILDALEPEASSAVNIQPHHDLNGEDRRANGRPR